MNLLFDILLKLILIIFGPFYLILAVILDALRIGGNRNTWLAWRSMILWWRGEA